MNRPLRSVLFLALCVATSSCMLIGYDLGPGDADGSGDRDGGLQAPDSGVMSGGSGGAGTGGTSGSGGAGGSGGTSGSGGGTMGAGADGGMRGDASVSDSGLDSGPPMPCDGLGEGDACDDGLHCTTGETCSAGACTGGAVLDCSSQSDACNSAMCSEAAAGCALMPVTNGTDCGGGQTCQDGDCATSHADCATAGTCNFPCAAGSCDIDCHDATDCAATCSTGTQCHVECMLADNCSATCANAAECALDCTDGASCTALCANASFCDIDCTNGNDCSGVICANGASCIMRCDGASNCAFGLCQGVIGTCPGTDTITCNAACP